MLAHRCQLARRCQLAAGAGPRTLSYRELNRGLLVQGPFFIFVRPMRRNAQCLQPPHQYGIHVHKFLLPVLLLLIHPRGIASPHPGDSTQSHWEFLPSPALLLPFPASVEEPRTGIRKEIGSSRMTLSIGGQIDLVEWRPPGTSNVHLRVGAQLFTYALTASYQGLRLQMDAADGYFGGYLVGRQQGPASALTLRFRIMHLSSHMLDGNYDLNTGEWKDGREPVPLSRDFGELLGAYSWLGTNWEVMVYCGFSYATLVRPPELMAWNTLFGVVAHASPWPGGVFGKPASVYLSDHFTLSGLSSLQGTNTLEVGLKMGTWEGSGVKIYCNYHSGLEVFHQYFDSQRYDWGLGIALDL